MKKILTLLILIPSLCFGQNLKFETKIYDAVDKWVAFNKNSSTYMVGFIYIDSDAGFTFDHEADFEITDSGLKKLPKPFNGVSKFRLGENTALVAVLTDEQINQLELPQQPDWLKHYKTDENKTSYLVKMGRHYNHVGASKKAIEILLKVYNKKPHFEGLEFELSYAYNATENYEKAIEVLTKAIKNDPNNFWFYRELGFTYINLDNIDEAEKIYKKGISLSDNKAQKTEMSINMVQYYFYNKNRPKFEEWVKITKQNIEKGSQFEQHLEYFETNWVEE